MDSIGRVEVSFRVGVCGIYCPSLRTVRATFAAYGSPFHSLS